MIRQSFGIVSLYFLFISLHCNCISSEPRLLPKQEANYIFDDVHITDIRMNGEDFLHISKCQFNITSKSVTPAVQHTECGYRSSYDIKHFPWSVAVTGQKYAADKLQKSAQCGGTILAPTVVLTAAQCVANYKNEQYLVRAGTWHNRKRADIITYEYRRVQEVILHEYYAANAYFNDIAILFLATPFVWQHNIRPICLPQSDANFDKTNCLADAWYASKSAEVIESTLQLKNVKQLIAQRDSCRINLAQLKQNFDDSILCTILYEYEHINTANEGLSLACASNNRAQERYYLVGIYLNGLMHKRGWMHDDVIYNIHQLYIYANITYLRSWIHEKLYARGIDFRHFTP